MDGIITIGREFGSGGRELGKRLSDELGIAYYDREIITEIAKRTSLSEGYIQQIVEHQPITPFPIHVGRSFRLMNNPVWDHEQAVWQEQCNIIREMAQKSGCIIVGRCADYLLREQKPYRIFVYADIESRIARCIERGEDAEKITEKEMRRRILDIDRARAKYYEFHTCQKWGERLNYDLCINTTNADLAKATAAIAKLFA